MNMNILKKSRGKDPNIVVVTQKINWVFVRQSAAMLDNRERAGLWSLPAELLVAVLHHCKGGDLLAVAAACPDSSLAAAAGSPALWRAVVTGPGLVRPALRYCGPHTTRLTVAGSSSRHPPLSDAVIASVRLRCPALTHLTISRCTLDTNTVSR